MLSEEAILWKNGVAYANLVPTKVSLWAEKIKGARPFTEKSKYRTLTPKVIIGELYNDVCACYNLTYN